jgi:hypothetical protein
MPKRVAVECWKKDDHTCIRIFWLQPGEEPKDKQFERMPDCRTFDQYNRSGTTHSQLIVTRGG